MSPSSYSSQITSLVNVSEPDPIPFDYYSLLHEGVTIVVP